MTRPRKERCIDFSPCTCFFEPQNSPEPDAEIALLPEELEALRLHDALDLDQNASAKKMAISQSTFARIIKVAREKVARALVEGKGIRLLTVKKPKL